MSVTPMSEKSKNAGLPRGALIGILALIASR